MITYPKRRLLLTVLSSLVFSLASVQAQAKVKSTTIGELARTADLIVIGHDRAVESHGVWKISHFAVDEVLKGEAHESIRYLADPTWACDTAEANPGQRALLFVSQPTQGTKAAGIATQFDMQGELHVVSWAGRGRMPVMASHPTSVVVWVNDIRLPSEVQTSPGPEPTSDFIRAAPLAELRELIEAAIQETQP